MDPAVDQPLTLAARAAAFWDRAVEIWLAGDWAMLALAGVALAIFGLGIHIRLRLFRKRFRAMPERTLRRWIDDPSARSGPVGALLDEVTGLDSIPAVEHVFEGLQVTEVAPFRRDLRLMRICVTAAPLLGLFGTVTGMLATFAGLATGGGGDQTMALISGGISEALITTETGLTIALPGVFFQYLLSRKIEEYEHFLARLESLSTQAIHRRARDRSPEPIRS